MITTRRFTKADIPFMIDVLERDLKTMHYGRVRFDRDKVDVWLGSNVRNKSFFCELLVDGDVIMGCLVAETLQYVFSYEAFAVPRLTYILPEYRSLTAVTTLVKAYIAWAKERRVREIQWSQSSGFKVDKFPILARRLGFKQIGSHFNMEINK